MAVAITVGGGEAAVTRPHSPLNDVSGAPDRGGVHGVLAALVGKGGKRKGGTAHGDAAILYQRAEVGDG
jgi:hypothetical protein